MSWDAEGSCEGDLCPACGSADTVTFVYAEGYSEIDCRHCGFSSEQNDIGALTRYSGALLEGAASVPVPVKKLKA